MAAITAICIDLIESSAVSRESVIVLVDHLLREGYASLEGDTEIGTQFTSEELDEEGAPDLSNGEEMATCTNRQQLFDLLARYAPERFALSMDVFSRYGTNSNYSFLATELSGEVEKTVEALAGELACDGGFDMYMSVLIGSLINVGTGERDGWGIAIQGEGWFDGPIEKLEDALMQRSARFRALREALERIFGCATQVEMRIVG